MEVSGPSSIPSQNFNTILLWHIQLLTAKVIVMRSGIWGSMQISYKETFERMLAEISIDSIRNLCIPGAFKTKSSVSKIMVSQVILAGIFITSVLSLIHI